jgi:sulfite reductase alpha subunit-like flavoprotein
MTKYTIPLLALSCLLLAADNSSHAFQPASLSLLARSTSSALRATTNTNTKAPVDGKWVKNAGCGIATVASGDCLLFDPEAEGKLQGTGSLSSRIHNANNYVLPPDASIVTSDDASSPPADAIVYDAQHWLESLDEGSNLPLNFAKPNKPATATLLGRTRIIADDAPGDIQHIVLRLPEGMHYVEGQSLSVMPPGIDAKTNKKYAPRLYSIASTRYGDALDGNTISLCVRRAEYWDPDLNKIDPAKKGICSNFLCDAEPGTQMAVAGPVGKTMLLPNDSNDDVIMIATGTGIAPFRGFLHRLFMENTVARHEFGGTAWLVLGVPTTGGLLYKEEIDAMIQNGKLCIVHAI